MQFLYLFLFSFVFFQTSDWLLDVEEAKKIAQTENKKILLNFSGSDWCSPCVKMKKVIFESPDFQEFAKNNLVLLKADFPRMKKHQLSKAQQTHNDALAEKYNPNGSFPFTLLLDAEGKVLKTWDGCPDKKAIDFIAELK